MARPATYKKITWAHLFCIFLIASFLGAITETVFMLITRGELMNRSGVLFGQFSLVWGFGAALFTCLLQWPARFGGKWGIFLGGALVGTCFEFLCSLLQENLFGLVFWDYSHLPFSIGGRINLVFSLFWGLAALLWMTALLPHLQALIARIPPSTEKYMVRGLAVFMVLNISVSGAALARLNARQQGVPAENGVQVFLDEHFSDQFLFSRFTNMQYIK